MTTTELTDLDRRMLDRIQASFPVASRPFVTLAKDLGVSEAEALACVRGLKASGVIRRIGAIFDSHRLGYRSTLCAIAVPEERIEEVAALISEYPNVTHNYEREDRYNVWFTLIAHTAARIQAILDEIAETTGIDDILDLPATRLFKIKVDFDFTGERDARSEAPVATRPAETEAVVLSREEKALARLLQGDLHITERPFLDLAKTLLECGYDVDENWVLERTREWVDTRVIRRFGAAIRHHRTGFSANAMGVWHAPEERVEEVGAIMASFKEVSHCYQRPSAPTWPANLYTMIHGRTREECVEVARRIREATGLEEPRLLYSVREFKKTSMKYFAEGE
ncbi:MAG: Lrp/AsnC family transcriptional regulator [Actinomycetota bacterium]|nr:MAG: AsnC family transcriptional [Actinomycetota bacterium]MDP3629696.1 Lrp/AsnC family transcriptional regulator [Actinomycetota bacterium]